MKRILNEIIFLAKFREKWRMVIRNNQKVSSKHNVIVVSIKNEKMKDGDTK